MATSAPPAPPALPYTPAPQALVHTTMPELGVPVPSVILEIVASAIVKAIVVSGCPTILSSKVGNFQVLSPHPDGTADVLTLAAALNRFRLTLRDVVPPMVAAGLVKVVGSGPTTAFARPGTAAVSAATPPAPAIHESICNRASKLAPLKMSQCGLDSLIKALVDQLKKTDPGAKLKDILAADPYKRFEITGTLGTTMLELAASAGGQAAVVPPVAGGHVTLVSIPKLKDELVSCIGSDGILASRFGKRPLVKDLTEASGMTLKALIGYMPGYEMHLAVPGSPGTATIKRTTAPEA